MRKLAKANDAVLWQKAGDLGFSAAYNELAGVYRNGQDVERDRKKAKHYYELASMGGNVVARYNLGTLEMNDGNVNRAMKHFMIAAGAGKDKSLKAIQELFMNGHVTKDDFEKALRSHKEAKDQVKSNQREAAAASGNCN